METPHELARELNAVLERDHPQTLALLSQKGRRAYFPSRGILAQSADAQGKQINATIGIALDEDTKPISLSAIASRVQLDAKDVFPYAPSYGKPQLRTKWQEEIRRKNPSLQTDISVPVVTGGLTHSLSVAGYLFLDPGDEVLLPEPYWDNYELVFAEAYEAALKGYALFVDGRFNIDGLKSMLQGANQKKIVFLNFPENPTGYTPLTEEAHRIRDVIRESAERGNRIVVLIDDAYFGLVYEAGVFTESIFTLLADLHENVLAVKIDGSSKEDFSWGLRVGFVTYAGKGMTKAALKVLEDKTAGVVRGTVSNCSHPSQSLLLTALQTPGYEEEKQAQFALLKRRYDAAKLALEHVEYASSFRLLPCNSGYFLCLELAPGLTGEQVRRKLLDEYSTGVIAFGNLIRVAFSSVPTKDIPVLFENIHRACLALL